MTRLRTVGVVEPEHCLSTQILEISVSERDPAPAGDDRDTPKELGPPRRSIDLPRLENLTLQTSVGSPVDGARSSRDRAAWARTASPLLFAPPSRLVMLKRLSALILSAATLAACSESSHADRTSLAGAVDAGRRCSPQLTCQADVAAQRISCAPAAPSLAAVRRPI